MHDARLRAVSAQVLLGFLIACTAGCASQKSDQTASPAPEISATVAPADAGSPAAIVSAAPASAAVEASDSATAAASGSPASTPVGASPTPQPTDTPNPNLLSSVNGAIVRAYPTALTNDPQEMADRGSVTSTPGPYTVVFELPGVAKIDKLQIYLPQVAPSDQPAKAVIAASTTSATDGFHDVATMQSSTTADNSIVATDGLTARWLRLSLDSPTTLGFHGLYAFGTLLPRPPNAPPLAGTYVERAPYELQDGTFHPEPKPSTDPWNVGVVTLPGGATGQRCSATSATDGYPGAFDGRVWTWDDTQGDHGRYLVNDEASVVAGMSGGSKVVLTRVPGPVAYCGVRDGGGKGADRVLVLDLAGGADVYPIPSHVADVPGEHFDRVGAGLLDPSQLPRYSTVLLDMVCKPDANLSPLQSKALIDWVGAGHKLIVTDSDQCRDTKYDFLPYPFVSNNPGANGASSDRLIEVENDALGSLDPADPQHRFDPKIFIGTKLAPVGNQVGDANTVTSQDPHWCGHLFGTNVNHVNGFMQMYAIYGKGLIIYDGFDHDDDANPGYQRVRRLELAATPESFLPCSQSVSLAFIIQPNRTAKFTPGKPARLNFPMELLANQGYKGHVTVSTTGDFAAKVTPSSFDVDGGTQPLQIALGLPGSTKPGTYVVVVDGAGSDGKKAQASITIEATTPIAKQLKVQRRIRLYGIHFDVDSAHIQPQSEPVIKEVAQIMRGNPEWRFRIEGHTDSDGGLQHNKVLSQARAQSVVDDLVKRYHIARGRMIPVGFWYSRPVASNDTSAGKALNRRVELVRL